MSSYAPKTNLALKIANNNNSSSSDTGLDQTISSVLHPNATSKGKMLIVASFLLVSLVKQHPVINSTISSCH